MITVVATICLGVVCHDERVTSSRLNPDLSMQWCMVAQPQIADWMTKNWPGYTLSRWRCELGERRSPV